MRTPASGATALYCRAVGHQVQPMPESRYSARWLHETSRLQLGQGAMRGTKSPHHEFRDTARFSSVRPLGLAAERGSSAAAAALRERNSEKRVSRPPSGVWF